MDDGDDRCFVSLDNPSKGLIVENMIWHEMNWCLDDSVLVVAASNYYDEADYIRIYDDFIVAAKRH